MTEIFGEFRCGKTQLAATLCVNAQLERASGGAAGKVIVLDTENAFRVERIAEIAEKRYGLDAAAVLDNVTIARCLTHEHQQEMALAAAALIVGSGDRCAFAAGRRAGAREGVGSATCPHHAPPRPARPLPRPAPLADRLLVVDSIIGLYRTEFAGRGELAERQQKLGAHIRDLVKLAAEFNLAVLVTNQVTADPGNMFVADAKKPVGGKYV